MGLVDPALFFRGSADFGELDSTELAEVSRAGASPSHASVPEPSTLVMLLTGMLAMATGRCGNAEERTGSLIRSA
jgi:hypothetical protein